ncbi:MAG: hypothetical protein R6U32_05365 [Candidatus Woesearchaeota archaeon]
MRGLIIAFSLAILLLLAGCSGKQEVTKGEGIDVVVGPEKGQETTPEQEPQDKQESPDEDAPEEQEEPSTDETGMGAGEPEKDLEEIKCDEKETFGFIGCTGLSSGDAELTIRNSGRVDLDGALIRYFNEDGELLASSTEMFSLDVGEDTMITLENSENHPKQVEVFPVKGSHVCINKQLVVIPMTNCR